VSGEMCPAAFTATAAVCGDLGAEFLVFLPQYLPTFLIGQPTIKNLFNQGQP